MRKCPKCGKQYDDSWKICIKCNVFLEEAGDRLTQLENQAKQILQEIKEIREGRSTAQKGPGAEVERKEKPQAVKEETAAPKEEDTETRIGKYFLNKVGVISLVAGVAFFVVYTFQYLTPLYKTVVGYIISALLILAGIRIELNPKLKWYGRTLVGGGWALTYFITYAIYHIEATKIIQNQLLDLILLALVVTSMIVHLLRYRSQGVVAVVLFLGYFTAGISDVAYFTLIYITLLAIIAVSLAYKMKWYALPLFSMIATYLTHFIWIEPQMHLIGGPVSMNAAKFWLGFSFLCIYWVVYNAMIFISQPEGERNKNLVISALFLNSFCFGLLGGVALQEIDPALRFNFFIISGLCTAAIAFAGKYAASREHLFTSYMVAAIAFLTAALPFKLEREWVNVLWLVEIPLLTYLSLYCKSGLYRIISWGLALITFIIMLAILPAESMGMSVFGQAVRTRLFVLAVGILCFYAAKLLYKINEQAVAGQRDAGASNLYAFSGTLLFALLTLVEAREYFITLSWALGAFVLFAAGFLLKDRYLRYSALALIAAAILRIAFIDLAGLEAIYRILVFIGFGAILLVVSYIYAKVRGKS